MVIFELKFPPHLQLEIVHNIPINVTARVLRATYLDIAQRVGTRSYAKQSSDRGIPARHRNVSATPQPQDAKSPIRGSFNMRRQSRT
jgi:hypothetical protein